MKSTYFLLLSGVHSQGKIIIMTHTVWLISRNSFYPFESLFITNTTISFKMKYPNLADVLDTAAPGIDHSKVLSYGCQCQFLDGRPLVSVSAKISSNKVWAFFEIWNKAAAGNGHPVDEIDAACKQLGY